MSGGIQRRTLAYYQLRNKNIKYFINFNTDLKHKNNKMIIVKKLCLISYQSFSLCQLALTKLKAIGSPIEELATAENTLTVSCFRIPLSFRSDKSRYL